MQRRARRQDPLNHAPLPPTDHRFRHRAPHRGRGSRRRAERADLGAPDRPLVILFMAPILLAALLKPVSDAALAVSRAVLSGGLNAVLALRRA